MSKQHYQKPAIEILRMASLSALCTSDTADMTRGGGGDPEIQGRAPGRVLPF